MRLRREGIHVRSGPLSCTMVIDVNLPGPHVAYALGRSVGSAVQRNLLRRRLRVLVKERAAILPPGLLLFGASSRARDLSFVALGGQLDRLLAVMAQRSQGVPR